MPEETEEFFERPPVKISAKKQTGLVFFLAVFAVFYLFFMSAPYEFPSGKIIKISKGETAGAIADLLGKEKVIRSPTIFRAIIFLSGQERNIAAGDYLLAKKEGVFKIAYRLSFGRFNLIPIRVTIPEGTASFDIPKILGGDFYGFDRGKFLGLSLSEEGYLFPDTYLIYPNATAEEIITQMNDNFNKKIAGKAGSIKASGKTLKDVIIMASIIEREAGKPEDRKIISGILWKRLYIKMPLQVDAPFAYISNKSTYDLTTKDLKQDSPYNTYNRVGLPPTPICNPGVDSIDAAINPAQSKYLYYLSDKSGNMHYSVTFEEHKRNKALYIP